MFAPDLLKDKVIVVTGGGTGLGKSMAHRFGELGAKLVLSSRKKDVLDAAAAEFAKDGITDVLVAPADVRNPDDVDAMIKATVDRFGRVDVLLNNAAGNFLQMTEKLSPNAFATVIDIVLRGSFHCTLAAGKQMIAQGTGGSILSIVTPYAWTGSAYVVPSACAKAGVLAMTRSLAVEWARYKIRCNAIAPGPFPTEGAWARLVPPGMDDAAGGMVKHKIPAGRYGEHAELNNLAAYLLADESAYITGECVVIDGGEWLMGGEFNGFTAFDQTALGQMFDMMRPKK
ncbi:MAG TPA: SDR family oxidoreductase [Polyangia bacterium]|nr:SDR family oxidoreductase [Polyangia bacterium]